MQVLGCMSLGVQLWRLKVNIKYLPFVSTICLFCFFYVLLLTCFGLFSTGSLLEPGALARLSGPWTLLSLPLRAEIICTYHCIKSFM